MTKSSIFFLLLYAEISVGNKILYTYFHWISQRIETISDGELLMTIFLIHLKID